IRLHAPGILRIVLELIVENVSSQVERTLREPCTYSAKQKVSPSLLKIERLRSRRHAIVIKGEGALISITGIFVLLVMVVSGAKLNRVAPRHLGHIHQSIMVDVVVIVGAKGCRTGAALKSQARNATENGRERKHSVESTGNIW